MSSLPHSSCQVSQKQCIFSHGCCFKIIPSEAWEKDRLKMFLMYLYHSPKAWTIPVRPLLWSASAFCGNNEGGQQGCPTLSVGYERLPCEKKLNGFKFSLWKERFLGGYDIRGYKTMNKKVNMNIKQLFIIPYVSGSKSTQKTCN